MLNALCNDKELLEQCRCRELNQEEEGLKRMSYAHPEPCPEPMWNEPGTVVRPFSWHSGNFTKDQTVKTFTELGADTSYTHTNGIITHGSSSSSGDLVLQSLPANGHIGQSRATASTSDLDSLGSGGVLGSDGETQSSVSTARSLVPTRLTSGGHSPNNSDSVPTQKASVGVA